MRDDDIRDAAMTAVWQTSWLTPPATVPPHPIVVPAAVRPARVDRLDWDAPATLGRTPSRRRLRPAAVENRPSAVGARSSLHRAVDDDGAPAWVRRIHRGAPAEAFADDHREVRNLGEPLGVVVPALRGVRDREVWLDRLSWAAAVDPDPAIVDIFVESAITLAVADGLIVGLGELHVLAAGDLVVEDVGVLARLEVDQRQLLGAAIGAMVADDPVGLADAVAALCGGRLPGIADAACRATDALTADWTPAGVGMSLYQVACAAAPAGTRSEPLSLFAAELLHRLDLAHRHPRCLRAFADPAAVQRLLTPPAIPR